MLVASCRTTLRLAIMKNPAMMSSILPGGDKVPDEFLVVTSKINENRALFIKVLVGQALRGN